MASDLVREMQELAPEKIKADKYIANLAWGSTSAGFEKKQDTTNRASRMFDDRRVKTLEDGTELHIQISTKGSIEKDHVDIYGQTREVAAHFWVIKKDGKGSGTSQCYTMDRDGHWYLQSFRGYKSSEDGVELWTADGAIRSVDEKAVKEGVFDRIRKSGPKQEELPKQEEKQTETPTEKSESEKAEYKPRTWNDTRYVEDEFREAGKFKLIRADFDPNKREDPRDKMYAKRFRGYTKDGAVVEIQGKDGTETKNEKYSFIKNGQKITDEVIMKVWVLEKPKKQVFNQEKQVYEDRFEQTAICYVLTKENGWISQYGSRTGGAGIDYLDYNTDQVVDKLTRSNTRESQIWNCYQTSTVNPEPLLINLRNRLAA
ncbi:hypothetical protein HYS03_02615 [Candidatus Woesebacteria bacterium]|nr:hypothetical protein [Candidatus Woesebacteria bacterium]QQG47910.1 MAG: hypothetical protein HY044_02385 [Candidatus Woesebacteria bacterium]